MVRGWLLFSLSLHLSLSLLLCPANNAQIYMYQSDKRIRKTFHIKQNRKNGERDNRNQENGASAQNLLLNITQSRSMKVPVVDQQMSVKGR